MIDCSSFTQLVRLDLFRTSIADLSSLSDLENLEELDIRSSNVTDLHPLIGLPNLKRFYLDGNDNQNIDCLTRENFPVLKSLIILYDDYYPMVEKDKKIIEKLEVEFPNCRIGRTGLY